MSGPLTLELDVPPRAEWQRVWEACEHATFFQSPIWAEIWERATDGAVRAAPRRARFSDGREAILPLCFERKLMGLLDRHVASPSGTFGGWITSDALGLEHARLLLDELLSDKERSLVWRMNPYDGLALSAAVERGVQCKADDTHVLELEPGPEALLSRFRNGYKSDVKKARKSGRISIEPATTIEEWRAYYRVYEETLGRWGHQRHEGYPWRLFEVMAALGGPFVTLWLARHDGVVVSGELCMYARRHAVSWHAATLQDYLRSNVAKAQIFHVIEDAHARGYRWFDFNPSAGLGGVRAFKEGFGAKPRPAPLVYVDSRLKGWVRRLATRIDIPYAALSLEPLLDVLARAEPPALLAEPAASVPQPQPKPKPVRAAKPAADGTEVTEEAPASSVRESTRPARDSSRPSRPPPGFAARG